MKAKLRGGSSLTSPGLLIGVILSALAAFISVSRGDLVAVQNGDRYAGKVVSLDADTLLLQSEVLGLLRLPRERVAQITLGGAATGKAPASAAPRSRADGEKVGLLREQLGTRPDLIQRVQSQLLGGASPAVQEEFARMVTGFQTGKVSVGDIRAQAHSAAGQLRSARQDLGEEAGMLIDGYLSILDGFLRETGPAAPAGMIPGLKTNTAAGRPIIGRAAAADDED